MMPVRQQAAPKAPPAPVDADRLAQQIETAVEQALGQADQGAAARDGIRAAIDQMRAEIEAARAQGVRTITVNPQFGPDVIPPGAVDISIAFFATIAIIIVGLPLARAFARRMDRRGQAAPASEMVPRLDRIEQAVDAIAIEVERISENQRYTTRLVSEMRGLPAAGPVGGWQPAREGEPVAREASDARGP